MNSRLQVHYLCYWSPEAPPVATTVHQTCKLQTCTILQRCTRPGWYLSSSSPETTSKQQISRRYNIRRIISRQEPISVLIFPRTLTDWNQLSREQRLKPSVNSFRQSLFTDSSIDIPSHDTPAVTGPLMDIYRRTVC